MTNVKLCPLRKINGKTFDHCYKGKCAWYNEIDGECALTQISYELRKLRAEIMILEEKLKK